MRRVNVYHQYQHDICRFYLDFTVDASCGKCTPCREGTKKMLEILNIISSGDGTLADIDNSLFLLVQYDWAVAALGISDLSEGSWAF